VHTLFLTHGSRNDTVVHTPTHPREQEGHTVVHCSHPREQEGITQGVSRRDNPGCEQEGITPMVSRKA